jgi:hypothetical protein
MEQKNGLMDVAWHNVFASVHRLLKDAQWMGTVSKDKKSKTHWQELAESYKDILEGLEKNFGITKSQHFTDAQWAIEMLQKGAEVRRTGWAWQGWVHLGVDGEIIFDRYPSVNAFVNALSYLDMVAQDWEARPRQVAKGEY